MRWIFNAPIVEPWLELCIAESGVSRSVGHLLRQIPFKDEKEFHRFLSPSLQDVEAPELIEGLVEAVDWVDDACRTHKRIAILSDYDVDGVTSMALMARCFHALGYHFEPYFPMRETEGYGLTERVVERILTTESHLDCLISLDCGTNSIEAVEQLRKRDIKVIIVDHHKRNRDHLPDAIIVNPHVNPEKHSQSAKELCTAGLVFKWLHAWLKKLKKEGHEIAQNMRLKPFLDFVALGSVADLVPLRRENRLWVYYGLKEMVHSQSFGLLKLLECSGCSEAVPLTVDDVAFKIAPRVNASGRLDSAEIPYGLLTHSDPEFCRVIAQQLDKLNTERQDIEHRIALEAEAMIQERPKQLAYVLYKPSWHVGVVGIVAGRLMRKFNCPIFVLGYQDGKAKGSGRSIPEVNLVELLTASQEHIEQWGGHPAAVGLTLTEEAIEVWEQRLNELLREQFAEQLPEPTLKIADVVSLKEISPTFLEEIERLGPFGQGNEMPTFALLNVSLQKKPERFGKNGAHLRFKLNDFTVIAWNMGYTGLPVLTPIDLAVRISWNYWQSYKTLQLQLIDWRLSAE
ncbi:MAG: single-stranded-DNA-specific exonuclease RecJ [Opitutales bacterium]